MIHLQKGNEAKKNAENGKATEENCLLELYHQN